MHQFFVEDGQIGRAFVTITGTDVNHIRHVLRMKPGEKIRVSNQQGRDYFCEISELGDSFVQADILEKAVELGVYEIIPVAMKYCVVKLDAKKEAARIKRWQKLSEAAAKQSKRSLIPNIHSVMSFQEAAAYASLCDVRLIPYENEQGMLERYIDQMCFYDRQKGKNEIYLLVEDGS